MIVALVGNSIACEICGDDTNGLPDLKVQLQATDYGNFLQNEPSPIPVAVIDDKLRNHLVVQFHHIRNQCTQPLARFLDYIT